MAVPTPEAVTARALSRVAAEGDCIVSLYSCTKSGYAQIGWWVDGRAVMRYVHRVAWEAAHGPIPGRLTVDHICHNKRCLKLEHLRLLSNVDNGRRNALGRDFPVGAACKRGHAEAARMRVRRYRNGEFVRWGWTCGLCAKQSKAESYLRLKASREGDAS